jgi:hypothetical protein
MAGSISDFKSSFTTDLARPSRFDVLIPVPIILLGSPYVSSKSLAYRCETAQLPGRTFEMTEQRTYGPIEKYPHLTSYTDIDLTFLVDDDMKQKYMFDGWFDNINPYLNNNYGYKEDYATTITINQYDVTNKLSYSVDLFDAFPISVNQLDLDWSNEGVHKLNVTFAYTYWKNNSLF